MSVKSSCIHVSTYEPARNLKSRRADFNANFSLIMSYFLSALVRSARKTVKWDFFQWFLILWVYSKNKPNVIIIFQVDALLNKELHATVEINPYPNFEYAGFWMYRWIGHVISFPKWYVIKIFIHGFLRKLQFFNFCVYFSCKFCIKSARCRFRTLLIILPNETRHWFESS